MWRMCVYVCVCVFVRVGVRVHIRVCVGVHIILKERGYVERDVEVEGDKRRNDIERCCERLRKEGRKREGVWNRYYLYKINFFTLSRPSITKNSVQYATMPNNLLQDSGSMLFQLVLHVANYDINAFPISL